MCDDGSNWILVDESEEEAVHSKELLIDGSWIATYFRADWICAKCELGMNLINKGISH